MVQYRLVNPPYMQNIDIIPFPSSIEKTARTFYMDEAETLLTLGNIDSENLNFTWKYQAAHGNGGHICLMKLIGIHMFEEE